ncbi:putative protein C3orf67 like [Dissostichus eleginoides]|uniref:Uncharacterized protein n=1 Tax=Dissostichus eleginoides TaxID=100907 RepID=A0AAD9FGD3_DISEL|nr:putative protein C3orf67 like [Dissostichus eleginoides]
MSSDNASTWTHISKPVNQGHHYQKEMNPLFQSNPRCYVQRQKMSRRPTTCFGSFVEPGINLPGRSDSLEKSVMEAKDGVDGRAHHGRRSANTWNNLDLIEGRDESLNEQEKEDEYLNLLYDPCLNCYFDPKTGKYYELA